MAKLTITTDQHKLAFAPGETLRGEVTWSIDRQKNSRSGEVRLFYYTSGKGTEDIAVIATTAVTPQESSGRQKFAFLLPSEPYSFSGKLVSLIWALEFQMLKSETTERLEFVMAPAGKKIDLYANAEGKMPKYFDFKIG